MKPGTFASIYLTVHVCIAVLIKDEKQWIKGSDFTLRACSRKPPQYNALYFDHWYTPSCTESSFILHNHKWIAELCHPHHHPHPPPVPDCRATSNNYIFLFKKERTGLRVCKGPGHRGFKDAIYLFICLLLRGKLAFSLAPLKTDFLGDTLVEHRRRHHSTDFFFFLPQQKTHGLPLTSF